MRTVLDDLGRHQRILRSIGIDNSHSPTERISAVNLQLFLLIIVVITALAFDFTNGFHDTGNAMATSIASGALKPKAAVTLSAVAEPGRRVPVHRGRRDHRQGPGRRPTSSPSSWCSPAWSAASSGTC